MVFFLISVCTRPVCEHTCKLYTPSGFKDAYWAEAFSPSDHLFSIPHCLRSLPQMHVCMLQCQAVLHCLSLTHFLSVWAVIHVCPLSLPLSLAYLSSLFVHRLFPTTFFFLLWCIPSVQVIYKKFNVPCPFVDFALNATASGLNVNGSHPGGENDPACIPKMANLNSQVCVGMSLCGRLQIHLHCHGHWQTPTYAIVILSMLPVTRFTIRAWKSHFSLRHRRVQ